MVRPRDILQYTKLTFMSPGCTVTRVSTKLPRCRYVRLSLANQCGWVGINGAKCNSDLGNAARVLMQRPAHRMNDFAGFVLAVAYSPDFLHIDTVSLRIFAFPKAKPTYGPLRYENVGFPARWLWRATPGRARIESSSDLVRAHAVRTALTARSRQSSQAKLYARGRDDVVPVIALCARCGIMIARGVERKLMQLKLAGCLKG